MMGLVQQNRWQIAIAAVGIILSWAGEAFYSGGDAGKEVSKEEAKELIKRILALINMSLDDII